LPTLPPEKIIESQFPYGLQDIEFALRDWAVLASIASQVPFTQFSFQSLHGDNHDEYPATNCAHVSQMHQA
jgi:hypothetical protein